MMGSGEEEDDGWLTPTEDDDDVQRPSGPPESVSALVNRGLLYAKKRLTASLACPSPT